MDRVPTLREPHATCSRSSAVSPSRFGGAMKNGDETVPIFKRCSGKNQRQEPGRYFEIAGPLPLQTNL